MRVSSNVWHARWFRFVQSKIGSDHRYRNGTNLCHYLRVVLLWGPLMIGFWVVVGMFAATVASALFVLPFYGTWEPLAAFSLVLGVGAIIRLGYHLATKSGATKRAGDSIVALASHAYSVKQRFCPVVRFSEQLQAAE